MTYRMPKVGDPITFYPASTDPSADRPSPFKGSISHVWSESCVNLVLSDMRTFTSVLVIHPGQAQPSGYFCVIDEAKPVSESELAAAAVAPRVTAADVEAAIVAQHFFTAADGSAGSTPTQPVHESLKRLTFCVLVLGNGYTVTGESACASPANFDPAVGRRLAREAAVRKVWTLLGFELCNRLTMAKG